MPWRAQHGSPTASASPMGDAHALVGMETLGDEQGVPQRFQGGWSHPWSRPTPPQPCVTLHWCWEPLWGSRVPPPTSGLAPRSSGDSRPRRGGAGLGRAFPTPLPSFPSPFPVCAAGWGNTSAFSCFSAPGRLGPGSSPSTALPDAAATTCPGTGASHIPPCRTGMPGRRLSHHPVPSRGVFSPKSPGGLDPSTLQSWGWVVRIRPFGGVGAAWGAHGGAVPGLVLAGNSRLPWHREAPWAGDGAMVVVTPLQCPRCL